MGERQDGGKCRVTVSGHRAPIGGEMFLKSAAVMTTNPVNILKKPPENCTFSMENFLVWYVNSHLQSKLLKNEKVELPVTEANN